MNRFRVRKRRRKTPVPNEVILLLRVVERAKLDFVECRRQGKLDHPFFISALQFFQDDYKYVMDLISTFIPDLSSDILPEGVSLDNFK